MKANIYLIVMILCSSLAIASPDAPVPGVQAAMPREVQANRAGNARFTIEVDNSKGELDAECYFYPYRGNSNFPMSIYPNRVLVRSGESTNVFITLDVPFLTSYGLYIDRVCANCGASKEVCTSCKTSTSCEYLLRTNVIKQPLNECSEDSECGGLVTCGDGSRYYENSCVAGKCKKVFYAVDPCVIEEGINEEGQPERASNFVSSFLDWFANRLKRPFSN